MYKLGLYIPSEHKESVKKAMFQAGAGKIGDYDSCSFEFVGSGQFRPLEGSSPYQGSQGKIEKVQETRVEMVCSNEKIKKVLQAMKDSHPYEQPAYDVIEMVDL